MKTYDIKAIETGDNQKDVEFLKEEFEKIVKDCNENKEKDFEVYVDYGGDITLTSGKTVPCIKKWTKADINKWLKGFNDEQ